jgi:kynurenine formamidase
MATLVDLTMPIYEGMLYNPDHPRAPVLWLNQRHEITQHYYTELWSEENRPPLFDGLPTEVAMPGQGHGWQSEQMIIGTHMGTHVDAGLHFDPESTQDAAAIPLEACYGTAVLLDMRPICGDVPNYPITIRDLEEAERAAGEEVQAGDIVLLDTGHMAKYGPGPDSDLEKFFSVYPGLAPESSAWFIDRNVKLVGCDTLNIDCNLAVATHLNFLFRERIGRPVILIVENLMNLEKLPSRFTFCALPLTLRSASGSPVRAVAILD